MNDLPISFRPANMDDFHYIMSSFLHHFHKVEPTNFIPNDIYFPHQTKIVQTLLQQSPTIICCLDDDPYQIVGYLIAQSHGNNLYIHYGCVKGIYRRMGIMNELLKQANADNKTIICTHYFSLFPKLKDKYGLIYDPTILQELTK